MDDRPGKLFGARLLEWIEARGETGLGLAEKTGVSPTTISNLINGHISRPQESTLRRLAGHFKVSVEEFLAGPEAWEEQRRREWTEAVRTAERVRRWAREELEDELIAWNEDRAPGHVAQIQEILNEADSAVRQLWAAFRGEVRSSGEWEEYGRADSFYRELVDMVFEYGLVRDPNGKVVAVT